MLAATPRPQQYSDSLFLQRSPAGELLVGQHAESVGLWGALRKLASGHDDYDFIVSASNTRGLEHSNVFMVFTGIAARHWCGDTQVVAHLGAVSMLSAGTSAASNASFVKSLAL